MVDGFSKTPFFFKTLVSPKTPLHVLNDGSHPTCPADSQSSSDACKTVILGFSDKPEYNVFLSASSLALTPYPLVKAFPKNQIEYPIEEFPTLEPRFAS